MMSNINRFLYLVCSFSLAVSLNASTIYQQTFNNGTALTSDPLVNSSAIAPYFLNQSYGNGEITNSSNNDAQTGAVAPGVTTDGSGSSTGDFLVEGTGTVNSTGNDVLYASSSFTVAKNTNYLVSFQLVNVNNISPAVIQLQINGLTLLSAVTALGYYGDGNPGDNWQTFSAVWNSGSSTSASLTLADTNTAQNGNDFAVDNIDVAGVPEPSTLMLFGTALLSLFGWRRRQRGNA